MSTDPNGPRHASVVYLKRYKDCREAGFDLTSIPAMKWFEMLKRYGLRYTNRKNDTESSGRRVAGAFVWGFEDGHIVTCNNPLTGEYCVPGGRDPEIGYASYIGITGTPAFVKKVRAFIKRHAEYIKDEDTKRRSFV